MYISEAHTQEEMCNTREASLQMELASHSSPHHPYQVKPAHLKLQH